MANVLTDWRVAVSSLLTSTFAADNLQVVPGELNVVARDRDRACVFAGPFVPDGQDINDARPRLVVRYWKKLPKTAIQDVPNDPAPIEQLILDLAAMFQPKLTTLGVSGLAYFHVESIVPDYNTEYAVECTLVGWMRNPMEAGG